MPTPARRPGYYKILSDDEGFTFVETLVGLVVLLVVVGILGFFLLPPVRDIPALSAGVQTSASVAQLQSICARISTEITIPFWWPASCIQSSPGKIRVSDLSTLYSNQAKTADDLLSVEIIDHEVHVTFQGTSTTYQFLEPPTLALKTDADTSQTLLIVSIAHGEGEAYDIVLRLPIKSTNT